MISDSERASGQRINRKNSAAIPARVSSNFEKDILFAAWGSQIRISSHERVLGVYICIHMRMDDQYTEAVRKLDESLAIFSQIRSRLSLAIRLVVVNVFLFPLFSYLNRQFFMPTAVLRGVERKVLAFTTPVAWSKLGMFSAVGKLYGLRTSLRDLRLSSWRPTKRYQICRRVSQHRWPDGAGDRPNWHTPRLVGRWLSTSTAPQLANPTSRRCKPIL